MNVLPIWKQKEVKLAKAPAVVFFYTSELIRTASFALNSPIIHQSHHKVFLFFFPPPSSGAPYRGMDSLHFKTWLILFGSDRY